MSKPVIPTTLMSTAAVAAVGVMVFAFAGSGHRGNATRSITTATQATAANADQRGRIRANLDALPLGFEANRGQSDPQVKYMARGNGYTVFLTGTETVFAVHSSSEAPDSRLNGKFPISARRSMAQTARKENSAAIHMKLVGGNPQARITAERELPGRTNYFLGNDPSKWQRDVKQYAAVTYDDVYPGVNMKFHGGQRQLEFDFIVSPGASAAPIALSISGAKQITTDAAGNLVLASAAGDVLLHKPIAYQEKKGHRDPVDARFVIEARNQVGLQLGDYDRSRELVIDPSVSYATYLGGNGEDEVFSLALDSSDNVYLTGETDSSSGFPGGGSASQFYAFVTKLSSSGALSYTTFLGGSSANSGLAIAVDSSGNAYVTGITQSSDFPATAGVPEPTGSATLGSNCTNTKKVSGLCSDAFAFKLTSSGTLGWATFIGGSNDDDGYAIALDGSGNVWVAGDTFSNDFYPVFNASAVLSANFNNGIGSSPAPDDGFVVEINNAGTAPFLYATYLGGSFSDQINGIAVDSSNNVYVAGETASSDFPSTNGSVCGSDGNCNANSGAVYYDAFVTKLAGRSIGYSTYLGGSSDDYAFAITVDSSGDAYITGETTADDPATNVPYPTTNGAYSTTYNSKATANAFVSEVTPDGTGLVFSTFLGGSTQDYAGGIALDNFNDAYVTGVTLSTDFPTTSNAFQTKLNGNGTAGNSDAFITQVLAGGASLGFSTYLGGSGNENANASGSVGTIALDSSNNIWVGGSTNSSDFPVTTGTLEGTYGGNPYDGFVAQISTATVADFGISATTPSAVSPGSSATSTVTLTSLFGYNAAVTLSCSVTGSGSPAPSCSANNAFSTNPVTPTGAGATTTLTITTTGSSAALNRPTNIFYALWLPVVGLSLAGIRFTAGSGKKKLLGFLLLGIVMAMLFFLPACGGGSSGGGGGGGGCSGCTPAGSYTVTITGTDSNNVSHSAPITLTVN